jgi:WD40 repeat protein
VLFQANQLGATLPDNTGEIDPLEVPIGQANQMAFSPDGRRAVIASSDRSVRFYEVEGKRDLKRFIGHTASVWSVALSPDSSRALSGSMDTTVRLWDTATGQQLLKLDGHSTLVTCVQFSPDGKQALSSSLDGLVILWDLTKGKELQQFELKNQYINAIAISPDGKQALFGTNNTIQVWNLETGKGIKALTGHTAAVTSLAYSKDGQQALSGSDDHTIRLWNLSEGKLLQELKGHDAPIRSVCFNDSGKWGLSGSADSTVRLWKLSTGEELGKFTKHAEPIVQVAFLDNGKQTLSGSRDLNLLPWSIEKFYTASITTPKEVIPPNESKSVDLKPKSYPIGGTLSKFYLSPDSKKLSFVDLTANRLLLFDTQSGTITKGLRFPDTVDGLTSSADGSQLFFVGKGTNSRGIIVGIDPKTGTMSGFASDLGTAPAGFAVDANGQIFYTEEGKTGFSVWSSTGRNQSFATPALSGENWWGSYIGIAPNESWLYLSTPNGEKGVLAREKFPPAPRGETEIAVQKLPSSADYPVGGEFFFTADSKYLICKSGTVVNTVGEFKPVAKLDPFTSISVDLKAGFIYLVTPGNWLKKYSLTDWKLQGSWKLPATAYQMALDLPAGRLYLAVIDPQSIRLNPRAKGFGDLWVIELKDLK